MCFIEETAVFQQLVSSRTPMCTVLQHMLFIACRSLRWAYSLGAKPNTSSAYTASPPYILSCYTSLFLTMSSFVAHTKCDPCVWIGFWFHRWVYTFKLQKHVPWYSHNEKKISEIINTDQGNLRDTLGFFEFLAMHPAWKTSVLWGAKRRCGRWHPWCHWHYGRCYGSGCCTITGWWMWYPFAY